MQTERFQWPNGTASATAADAGLEAAEVMDAFSALMMGRESGEGRTVGDIMADVHAATEDARSTAEPERWSRFLRAHAHLIARAGASALLQLAIADADTSPVTR